MCYVPDLGIDRWRDCSGGSRAFGTGPLARESAALSEAVSRGDGHLGMEHVLLALLRDSESGAVETLGRLGVPPRQLHRMLERAIADAAGQSPPDASNQPATP